LWEDEEASRPSRVVAGLAAQQRSELWRPVSNIVVNADKPPPISVAELAHNLDEAETRITNKTVKPAKLSRLAYVGGPRVAGWEKRSVRKRTPGFHRARRPVFHRKPVDHETTAEIILRSLTSNL
jgi:hypothetical protein